MYRGGAQAKLLTGCAAQAALSGERALWHQAGAPTVQCRPIACIHFRRSQDGWPPLTQCNPFRDRRRATGSTLSSPRQGQVTMSWLMASSAEGDVREARLEPARSSLEVMRCDLYSNSVRNSFRSLDLSFKFGTFSSASAACRTTYITAASTQWTGAQALAHSP
jgi:hypothetical protein